jgi:hypothetical protein
MVNGSEDPGAPTIPLFGGPAEAPPSPPPPGWYPDPWLASQRRYWTGERWTLDTLPNGPDAADPGAAGALGAELPPAPPAWGALPLGPDPMTPPPDRRRGRALIVVATVMGLLIGLGAAYVFSKTGSSANSASPPATSPTTLPTTGGGATGGGTSGGGTTPPSIQPPDSADPGAPSLSAIVVTQNDVTTPIIVGEIPGGNEVSGETTLDVCNGNYPSEALRSARLQVAAEDPSSSNIALSTEAVLYKDANATAQAFAELRSVVAHCPASPVPSPVGEATATTKFNAAPDASWTPVAGVERLAYSFTTTDTSGNTTSSIAVYLRRGRALLGVYFGQPTGPQPAIAGQTSVAGIVNLFANRLARLPASVVNGTVS